MSSLIPSTTDQNFASDVLQSQRPVLVDFWAAWCGPCRALAPQLEKFASAHPEVQVMKMDVDANPESAMRLAIMAMPSMVLFQDGEERGRLVGLMPAERIAAQVQSLLRG